MPSASNLVSIDLIRLIMARSDHYRTRAEECRARAETSFTPEAWLKLAATWLALIPVSREAASERSNAMEQPVSGMTGPLRPDKGGEDYQSLEECVGKRSKLTADAWPRASLALS
jgi:hypothetical protein